MNVDVGPNEKGGRSLHEKTLVSLYCLLLAFIQPEHVIQSIKSHQIYHDVIGLVLYALFRSNGTIRQFPFP